MTDRQSPTPLSIGIAWAYRAIALGMEFSVPALIGYALDQAWDSSPWAMLIGAVLGFAAGMLHLVQLARSTSRPNRPSKP